MREPHRVSIAPHSNGATSGKTLEHNTPQLSSLPPGSARSVEKRRGSRGKESWSRVIVG